MRIILLVSLVLVAAGCQPMKVPAIQAGMDDKEVEAVTYQTFPPTLLRSMTIEDDGTVVMYYDQHGLMSDIGTHIIVTEKEGVVTQVRYIAGYVR